MYRIPRVRGDENKRAHARGIICGKERGDRSAPGHPDHIGAFYVQRMKQTARVLHHVVGAIGERRFLPRSQRSKDGAPVGVAARGEMCCLARIATIKENDPVTLLYKPLDEGCRPFDILHARSGDQQHGPARARAMHLISDLQAVRLEAFRAWGRDPDFGRRRRSRYSR